MWRDESWLRCELRRVQGLPGSTAGPNEWFSPSVDFSSWQARRRTMARDDILEMPQGFRVFAGETITNGIWRERRVAGV